jgi:hypothetical protein
MMRVSLTGRVVFLLLVFGCLSLTGCLGNRDWQYPPSSTGGYLHSKAAKPISVKVIVLPLEDLRGNATKDEYWKVAIPLMPYGDTHYERPETAENPEKVDVVRFDPPNDFAKAIAAELSQAGVFSSVKYVQDEKQEMADVVLRGSIRATDWDRRLTTWGFGPVGPVFWLLGAPMSWTTTTLAMDISLTPANNPNKVLWRQKMIAEGHWTDGIYYNLGEPAKLFPESLQEALKEAVDDLVNIANENPQQLMPR